MLDGEGADGESRRAVARRRRAARRPSHAARPRERRTARAASCTRGCWPDARAPSFHGRIVVRPGAQKTDAKQSNPQPAAVGRGARAHAAAARDPRRRRQVHARGDDRPARRGRDVLPAEPRRSAWPRPASCWCAPSPARSWSGSTLEPLRALGERLVDAALEGLPHVSDVAARDGARAACAGRAAGSTSACARGVPDPRAHGSTASRSSTSTTRRRRRSHARSLAAVERYYAHGCSNVHRGLHTLSAEATDGLRGGARARCGASSGPPTAARSSSPAARPRRSTSSRTRSASASFVPRRRDPDHRDGAPLEHRAVAAAVRAHGSTLARRADRRRGRAAPRRARAPARAAHPSRRRDAHVERARHAHAAP